MPKVSEAIRNFLTARKTAANADLIARWHPGMETQVNVAAGKGEPVEGKRSTYTDGVDEWWNIRCPKNADSEPEWKDYNLRWPLDLYAEGIGLTGWDWQAKQSRWVGFDVDSLLSHAVGVGISDSELKKVKEIATSLPYIEVRQSTGGSGLHLYCYLDNIPTQNHTEHAALARCILGLMSEETGFDFSNQIDCCGGVLWVWHRKLADNGLKIIKAATRQLTVDDLPSNWKDHVEVVTRRRAKVQIAIADKDEDPFEALASSRHLIPLDDTHKAVIDELARSGYSTVWISDYHLLQTHTKALEELLNSDLKIKGIFKTTSNGKDPATCNCFCFPLANGSWRVYRFSPGVSEDATWEQDGNGWTNCYFNSTPSLSAASKAHEGIEAPNDGGYVFTDTDKVVKTLEMLGESISIPEELKERETRLRTQKDGRIVISIKKHKGEEVAGWLTEKGKLTRVLSARVETSTTDTYAKCDQLIRALVSPEGKRAGWTAKSAEGVWIEQPKDDIKNVLVYHGEPKAEIDLITGAACVKPWKLVSLPFQSEYPGGRLWNKNAVQYLHPPADTDGPHPHWDMILKHCFKDLTGALQELPWAQEANIKTGADYGLAWMACLLREPLQPLPYLFLFGDENCGKSIFFESFRYLITEKGVVSANQAINNQSGFNGELAGAVLAYIEEIDISKTRGALAKIKEWVLCPMLPIRQMRTDTYLLPNTLHFVQTANDGTYCPIMPGDTRITMVHVPPLADEDEVARHLMEKYLVDEAPYFMRTIFNLDLPPVKGRLRLPIVETTSKARAQAIRRNSVEQFIAESYHIITGERVLFKDFYDNFLAWLPGDDRSAWSKQKITRSLPHGCPAGLSGANQRYVGNLSSVKKESESPAWTIIDGKLTRE